MTEKKANIPANINVGTYASLRKNGEVPEGDFGQTELIGPMTIKVTAASNISKGDYVTLKPKNKTEFILLKKGYITDSYGGKVAFVSQPVRGQEIKVTWTAYASSRRNVSVELNVELCYELYASYFSNTVGKQIMKRTGFCSASYTGVS